MGCGESRGFERLRLGICVEERGGRGDGRVFPFGEDSSGVRGRATCAAKGCQAGARRAARKFQIGCAGWEEARWNQTRRAVTTTLAPIFKSLSRRVSI